MRLPCLFANLALASVVATVRGDNHCFTSTSDMLTAQIGGQKDLVICPNTTIPIGLPTDGTFSSFAGGDLPLTAVADNVTIKCGEDGKSSNYCALDGGLVQFVTSPAIAQAPQLPIITTHNLKLQGITFTGTLAGLPGAGELSVILSTQGQNVVFEDCVFANLTTVNKVLALDNNALVPPEAFPPGSVSLTIKDSLFSGITYASEVIENSNQTLILENVIFEDLKYQSSSEAAAIEVVIYAAGTEGATHVNNCEFNNIEFKNTVLMVRGAGMTYESSGNSGSQWKVAEGVNETQSCPSGLIVATSEPPLDISNNEGDACMALTETPPDFVTADSEAGEGGGEEGAGGEEEGGATEETEVNGGTTEGEGSSAASAIVFTMSALFVGLVAGATSVF